MTYIKRYLWEKIEENLKKRKIILIFGARQVGKTTLVREFLSEYAKKNTQYLNGDFSDDQERLGSVSRSMVKQFEKLQLLVIDEAQSIPQIGMKLKVIHDTLPDIHIIATGSSSFDLSNKVIEPLTGRNVTLTMFPFSLGEAASCENSLEDILLYGLYPEVFLCESSQEKRMTIARIAESYLFKDVLNISYIKNPKSLEKLLEILASQIGSEVSFSELANTLDLDVKTVMSYVDILEKLFIIFPLYPFASNVRKSITKKRKYYFYDLGIRNAVLSNFSSLKGRDDVGALWENFVILERIKRNRSRGLYPRYFFFRSYKGEEIDFLEQYERKLFGFECKFAKNEVQRKIQNIFTKDLQGEGDITPVHKENYSEYIQL